MKLYYFDVLSPRKACAVAKYLKLPIEYITVDLTKGEQRAPGYLALNPSAKVPTLVDGAEIIREADAIICYMSDKASAGLWPHDPRRQIDVTSWFSWNAQHFTRATGSLYFENIIKPRFGIGAPSPAAVDQAIADFRRYAAVLDGHLKGRKWLVGDGLTVADFSVAVTLPYAQKAKIPIDDFPEVRRWHDQLNAFDAWREPFP
ncbi:MAG: glutathione S-transferase family protein [Reyranellales bacterium]